MRLIPLPYLLLLFTVYGSPLFLQAEQNMDSMDTFSVATSAALARVREGDFKNALSAEMNAMSIAENRFGKTHPSVAAVLTDLATIHRYMGLYPEAESELKWALAIRERALEPNNLLIADSLENLACFYNDWGRWKDALYYGNKAVELYEKLGTSSSPSLSRGYAHLGEIQLNLGDKRDALESLGRTRELLEKHPSPDPLVKVGFLNLMAEAYLRSKKTTEAETCLKDSLEWVKAHDAVDSVEMGDALKKLGDFYGAQGRKEKAQAQYEAAFKVYRRFVGVNYTYPSLPYLRRLAGVQLELGQAKEAKDLLEKTLQSSVEVFGNQHPQVALDLWALAQAEKKLGEKDKAQKHLKEALNISQAFFPPDHPLTVKIRSLMGL